MSALSATECTVIVTQLCLKSQTGLWENVTTHHLISFVLCGVYKYCYSVYAPVWCGDEVRSANCARTIHLRLRLQEEPKTQPCWPRSNSFKIFPFINSVVNSSCIKVSVYWILNTDCAKLKKTFTSGPKVIHHRYFSMVFMFPEQTSNIKVNLNRTDLLHRQMGPKFTQIPKSGVLRYYIE